MARVALAKVQNLARTLVHHVYLDETLPALTALVGHTLALGIQLSRRELYPVENVLLHVVPLALVLIVALVRHIHMEQRLAGRLQLTVLLRTDAKLLQRYLEVEQVAREVLRLEQESALAHAQLLADAVLQLRYDRNHQVRLHQREVAANLRIAHRVQDKIQIAAARELLHQLIRPADNSRSFFLRHFVFV